MEVHVALNTEI